MRNKTTILSSQFSVARDRSLLFLSNHLTNRFPQMMLDYPW